MKKILLLALVFNSIAAFAVSAPSPVTRSGSRRRYVNPTTGTTITAASTRQGTTLSSRNRNTRTDLNFLPTRSNIRSFEQEEANRASRSGLDLLPTRSNIRSFEQEEANRASRSGLDLLPTRSNIRSFEQEEANRASRRAYSYDQTFRADNGTFRVRKRLVVPEAKLKDLQLYPLENPPANPKPGELYYNASGAVCAWISPVDQPEYGYWETLSGVQGSYCD